MKPGYKTALAGLFMVCLSCAMLFYGRTATAAPPSTAPFTFITVDVPVQGAGSTMVVGINNRGDIVGSYNYIPGAGALGLPAGFLGKGFVWRKDGTFTTIDGPGPVNPQLCQPPNSFQNCYYIEARGINDRGDIVGAYSQDVLNPNGGLFRAFFEKAGGKFTSYLFPGHSNTIFQRIKDSGVIYGCFHDYGEDNSSQESMHAIINLLRPNSTIQNLSFDPAGTTMNVGGGPFAIQHAGVWYDFTTQRHRAYVITGGHRVDFDVPGSNLTQAWDMNVEGDVVGVWGNNADPIVIDGIPFHGYIRDRHGNFIGIDYPGSIDTHVFGINDWGALVGSYVDKDYNIHGFIARPGDRREDMQRSEHPANVNVSFGFTRTAMSRTPTARVALMPLIPKDTPLLAPAQAPACHHIQSK
jgi:hypothetical protein